MRWAALVVLTLLAAGCASRAGETRDALVPYPRLHESATYAVSGSLADLARWENGAPITTPDAKLRFSLLSTQTALDAARTAQPTVLLREELLVAGGAVKLADLYVSPAHQALVQGVYPLSGDQSIVAFDERGYPWLFGASALFGEAISPGATLPVSIPDNLGHGHALNLTWRVVGSERVGDVDATRLDLDGSPSLAGSLWMQAGSPWPVRATLTLKDAGVEPLLRAQSYPAHVDARRQAVASGDKPLPPRDRAATFGEDAAAPREAWDGTAPPDGSTSYEPYLLSEAIRDAKLLDTGLQTWTKGAQSPILYRATFKPFATPAQGVENETWLLVFVDQRETYYQVQMGRLQPPPASSPLPAPVPTIGAPRVESSGPYEPPASANHGWFPKESVPAKLVPLAAGIDVVRSAFGAKGVQIFLRSFQDPPGYQYFLDGGWDGPKGEEGRYTVVYDPETGLLQEATGHGLGARLAS
ncbi:MAG: hypothetical protein QOE90_3577 [Thermoplasmata archaeon]|jgi:hypothetical protein|nr:hypothetical protein [Thermoplasmata archaeon]